MSAARLEKLDEAVFEVRGYVALLGMMKDCLDRNAEASKLLVSRAYANYTVQFLTGDQSLAFDFLLNKVIAATDDLSEAFDKIEIA